MRKEKKSTVEQPHTFSINFHRAPSSTDPKKAMLSSSSNRVTEGGAGVGSTLLHLDFCIKGMFASEIHFHKEVG